MAVQYGRRKKASARAQTQQIARGLGWFSVGLGLAQVFAPRALCRLAGVPVSPIPMRLCGLRELVCGLGILTQEQSAPWLEARIAGDVIDLTALAGAAAFRTASGPRIAFAMAATGGITALDLHCKRILAAAVAKVPCHVKATITVNGSADDLYRFWRDLQNFPRIMPHVESVQPLGDNVYHWVALGPAGTRIEWDSEVIDDQPGERLAWRSLEGSDIFNAGSVAFDRVPDNFGTQVTVELLYQPPASSLGAAVAQLFGRDANREMRADLRAFKMLIESREKPAA